MEKKNRIEPVSLIFEEKRKGEQGDKAFREITKGLINEVKASFEKIRKADDWCCFEVCCVSVCCVRVDID